MKTILTLLCAWLSISAFAQTAKVQIIHNAPTPTVDIYAGTDRLLNDFAFRTATPFIDVPAGVVIALGVAPGSSNNASESIARFNVSFESGKTYVVVATGIVGGTPGFDLKVFDQGRTASANAANVDLLFYHGSPDAPVVDVTTGGTPIINDVAYGQFQGYLSVPAASYDLSVTPGNDNSVVVASYRADFSFWKGGSAVIFASGFLSGNNPAFEPWVALSNGGTFPLASITTPPPPGPTNTARVQVIHNAPTPTVDIYAGNNLLLNDFAFRTATPFVDLPADTDISLGVALSNSNSAADAIARFNVRFEKGKTYVVVATGIVGGTPGFELKVFDQGRETAAANNVGILFFHGSPDAPVVDVVTGGSPIINNAAYGDFQGYLEVPATFYELSVTPGNDNSVIVAKYGADLSFWKGNTAVIFASGFLSGNDPAFEPWVALSNGGTFPLPKLAGLADNNSGTFTTNNTRKMGTAFRAYPNPTQDQLHLEWIQESTTGGVLRMISADGRLIRSENLSENGSGQFQTTWDVQQLTPGIYYLQWMNGASLQQEKILIQD